MTTSAATVNINTITLADLNHHGISKVAENINTSEELFLEIIESTDAKDSEGYLTDIAGNKGATVQCLTAIAEKVDWNWSEDTLKALAKNTLTPVQYLLQLVDFRVAGIRVAAIKNPNTPTEAIEAISRLWPGKMVRQAVDKELARRSAL